MTDVYQNLTNLQLSLPDVPAPAGSYINATQSGNLLYLSGGIPPVNEEFQGKVPSVISIEKAKEAARIITLNRLAVIAEAIGDLNKVTKIVTVNGFVNSDSDFYQHPVVINACSELLIAIFGEERGQHTRTALGAAALPLNVCVEINMIVEVVD